ncbi:helix-turn-helix domain-containing protein [Azospirillum argentinense]
MQQDAAPAAEPRLVYGRAQRAETFPHVADLATTFRGTDRGAAEIVRLVLFAGSCLTYLGEDGQLDVDRTLSAPAVRMLALLCEHIHTEKWQSGNPYVWTSNDYLAMRLGLVDARQVRRLLSELEQAGYIVRRYNRRNQRLDRQGIDLRPFGARLDAIEEASARMEEMFDLRRAERHAEWDDGAQHSNTKFSTKIPEQDSCLEDIHVRLESTSYKSAEPKGSVDKWPSDHSVGKVHATDRRKAAEMFELVVVASTTFRRHLIPADQKLPTPSVIGGAAVDILRTKFRALRPDVWPNAVQRHGIAVAAAALALAADRPGVSDRTRYLASLLAKPDIGATVTHSLRALIRSAGSGGRA